MLSTLRSELCTAWACHSPCPSYEVFRHNWGAMSCVQQQNYWARNKSHESWILCGHIIAVEDRLLYVYRLPVGWFGWWSHVATSSAGGKERGTSVPDPTRYIKQAHLGSLWWTLGSVARYTSSATLADCQRLFPWYDDRIFKVSVGNMAAMFLWGDKGLSLCDSKSQSFPNLFSRLMSLGLPAQFAAMNSWTLFPSVILRHRTLQEPKCFVRNRRLCSVPTAVWQACGTTAFAFGESAKWILQILSGRFCVWGVWSFESRIFIGVDGQFDPIFLVRISCTEAKQEKEAIFWVWQGMES